MRKIRVRYKVFTGDYYTPVKYRQATFIVKIPVNAIGIVLVDTLTKLLEDRVREKEGNTNFTLLHHQV